MISKSFHILFTLTRNHAQVNLYLQMIVQWPSWSKHIQTGMEKKQGISWPIRIYTLITSQWQRSSEESALMKVKQGNLVVRHIIVSFIRYTHTCLVPTPLKNWWFVTYTVSFLTGGIFRFHVSIFWRNKWSEMIWNWFHKRKSRKKHIDAKSPCDFFFPKKICPKLSLPTEHCTDLARIVPAKHLSRASLRVPLQRPPRPGN